jgi:dGTPase
MSIWEQRREEQGSSPTDARDEYDRDLSRLIHSSAFRRLQSKTQVLGLGESDFYRTRLTHSMEVAQIGVGILWHLNKLQPELSKDILPTRSLMETICLAHDIGHPPFGHGGEIALNICMLEHGGFEGNGQTLRILSKLDQYMKGYGLNPTRRTLLGILKYPSRYSRTMKNDAYPIELKAPLWANKAGSCKPPKCYFDVDQNVIDFVLEPLSINDLDAFTKVFEQDKGKHSKPKYHSIDTSIMELADDISYGVHDLEDGISLGMITRLEWDEFFSSKKNLFDCFSKTYQEVMESIFSRDSSQRKIMIGSLVHFFISNTSIEFVKGFEFECNLLSHNAKMKRSARELLDGLQDCVVEYMIKNDNVQQLEFKGQKLIVELFEVFNSDPKRLLPKSTYAKYKEQGENIRVICDYVSGMTDDYAVRQFEKLFVPNKGSVFERI